MRLISTTLSRFRRDQTGVTAIEFSIVGFPFFAVLAAIFEIAFVHYQTELLTAAVSKAARSMLTGQTQASGISTASQFVDTYLCPASGRILPSNIDCSKLIVDVRAASSFTAGDMSSGIYKSSANKYCPGAPGQIMVIRVAYPLTAFLPMNLFNRTAGVVNDVPNQSGSFHILLGAALFQGENYETPFVPSAGC